MNTDEDTFEQAIDQRINNINDVDKRDGETPNSSGLKAGFQYALEIYRDIKEHEQ